MIINAFISYAQEDEPLLKELENHLASLRNQGIITTWNNLDISAGTEWEHEVETHLNAAHVILLLVSPNFLASKYCCSIEMKRAIERHDSGEAHVIPIILRPADWKNTPFGKLQALPRNGRSIAGRGGRYSRDQAFLQVVMDIRGVIERIKSRESENAKKVDNLLNIEEKSNQQQQMEQNAESSVSITPVVPLSPLGSSGTQSLGNEKSITMSSVTGEDVEQVDMGEAPHVEHFYGRLDELATIQRWIVDEHCRLVSIIGLGGIGKTSLVAKLIDQNLHVFNAVFWRSLLNAPPLERILQECLQFLTRTQQIEIPQDLEKQMRLLVAELRKRRCLLVLDNAEAILKSSSSTGEYKDGYEEYGQLIHLFGESRHQSCLLVTSREQLREIVWLEGEGTSVRSYRVGGLKVDDARVILERKGLSGEEYDWKILIERFSGNPMMLTFILPTIRESYRGLISQYLADFGDVPLIEYPNLRMLLDRQFERLSFLEQQVIYWLAIEREAVSLQDLRENIVQSVSKGSVLVALEALQRRSWIEQSVSGRFTLQPAMMDAVIDRFNEFVVQEIISDKSELFTSHTLIKARAKDYIRKSQFQLILNIIVQKLFTTLDRRKLEENFRQRLIALRNLPEQPNNYEAGNILNLLVQAGYELRGYDFSHLVVRQAYLQEAELPEINFAHSNLATSVFTDTFGNILSVALSTHGDLLAAGTATSEIRIWNAASGLPLQTFREHTDWVWSVAFSPDGIILASGSSDQTVRLWEVSSGQCLNTLEGHTGAVWSVAFSPDGHILASGSDDQTVRLWEVSSDKCLNSLHSHTGAVRSVAYSPNGHILASGSDDQTVRLWEISSSQCLNILRGHSNWISSVAFSLDGHILASGSNDQTVRLWEVSSGQCLNILKGYANAVWSVDFSPDGSILASGNEDRAMRLWEVSSDKCLNTLHGHTNAVRSVASSPVGGILASGSHDQTVRLWEVSSGQCLNTLRGHTSEVWSVAFSPDGSILASGSRDQMVRLWEVSSGQGLKTLPGHSHWVWSVAFSPDGSILASGSEDQTVRLWEVSSGQCLNTLQGHSSWISSVAFSPDGHILASGSNDQLVRLWEMSSGQCLKTLHGHTSTVSSVAFSPDGHILASGSFDLTVRLWEVSSGQCLNTLQGHSSWISSVAFSPDGSILASGGYDGEINLWDRQTGAFLRTLRNVRPYERMNITQVKGLTEVQKAALRLLGAIEEKGD
jgi:WD40 repeat protein